MFSCGLKKLNSIFDTAGKDEFKSYFIKAANIMNKLDEKGFKRSKMWSRKSKKEQFKNYKNGIEEIRIK